MPVFANVQRAIESEVEDIDRALSDKMEKAGERAGDKAGKAAGKKMREAIADDTRRLSGDFEREFHKSVDSVNKALGGIDIKKLGNDLRKEVTAIKREMSTLKDVDISAEADFRRVFADLAVLQGRLQAVRDDVKIVFRADVDNALRGMSKIAAAKESIEDPIEIEVRADFDTPIRQMGNFERSIKKVMDKAARHMDGSINKQVQRLRDELDYLGKLRVGVDISASRLMREVGEINRELDYLATRSPEIDVKFEAGRAWAELAAFDSAVRRVDGKTIEVHAKVDNKGAISSLQHMIASGDTAANTFRSFNAVLLAAVGAGPALIPILGGIAGGLLAIGPAAAVAGVGLGSVLLGFSGIGDAVKALQNQQDSAAMTAQSAGKAQETSANGIRAAEQALADARQNAARAAEDAAERVAEAREAAAEAIEAALERQKEAQEAYRDSVLEVRDAEKALKEARQEARGTGDDIKDSIRDNKLAIDQALLDSFNATVTYNAVKADGSSTNAEQEQARIDMEEARNRLDELREEQEDLAKQKRKWDRQGVDGTEEVQSAQEQLQEALEAQREAYEDLREAAEGVDEARADGAEMVRDALEAQNETLADNRQSVANAARALQEARRASEDTTQAINAQQAAVDNAMNALGPAGQAFAEYIFGLRSGFRDLRDDIQAVMLPDIQKAMESFFDSDSAAYLRGTMIGLADGFGEFAKALSRSLQGDVWLEFFKTLHRLGPDIQKAYGKAFIAFLEAMASILTVLAPYALSFARAVRRLAEAFAEWADSKDGAAFFQRFMDYAKRIGPKVLDFFVSLSGAVLNLLIALAPYGELILGILTNVLDMIATMDPKLLGAIVSSIIILITASQIAYGISSLLIAGLALAGSWISLIVFALVGLGLGIAYLWKTNEGFRDAFVDAWTRISDAFMGAWEHLKPALMSLADSLMDLWDNVLRPLFEWLGPIIVKIIETALPILMRWWGILARVIGAAIDLIVLQFKIMSPIFGLIVDGLAWVFEKIGPIILAIVDFFMDLVEGAFDLWDELFGHSIFPDIVDGFIWFVKVVTVLFQAVAKVFLWIYDKIIKPVFTRVSRVVKWLWENYFKHYFFLIRMYVKGVFTAIKWVWQHVLEPVFDAIATVARWLWKNVLKPVFDFIGEHWETVVIGMKAAWRDVLKPTWDAIKNAANWLWKNILRPIFSYIRKHWEDVMDAMEWAWENVLQPVFEYIADKALPALRKAFRTVVDAIKSIWDGLKKVVGTPIKFVLETVLNNGIIAGFNKVADFVGAKEINDIAIPDAIQNYATGGVLPGYTPGRDVHHFVSPTGGRLNLSGGEAIMRPEVTAALGTGWVDEMNYRARKGGVSAVRKAVYEQNFAKGGKIMFPVINGYVIRSAYNLGHDGMDINHADDASGRVPFFSATSGRVSTTGYDRGYGNAVFINTPYGELVYGHAVDGSIRVSPGQAVSAGTALAFIGNTGRSTGPHLHFGFPGGTFYQAEALLAGAAEPDGGKLKGVSENPLASFPGWLIDIARNPIGYVKDLVSGPIDRLRDRFADSRMIDMLASAPGKLVGAVKNKIVNILPGPLKKLGGDGGEGGEGAPPPSAPAEASFYGGGILGRDGLRYNGTMKYDAGGYLPPGLTSVMNLTGRPEPVFTDSQFSQMRGGAGGGNIHYEPHFEGSDLTAADVAGDLNFTIRKIRRRGKYAEVGD